MSAPDKVARGEKFRPQAALHNTLVDVAEAFKSGRLPLNAGAPDLSAIPQTIVRVRNDTGQLLGRNKVIALDEPLRDPDAPEFRNDLAFSGIAPTADHKGRWGVTLQSIADGQIGDVIIAGVALARVIITNALHKHVECAAAAGVDCLVSSLYGSARLLWHGGTADEDGTQWALVRLGDHEPHRSYWASTGNYGDGDERQFWYVPLANDYCQFGDDWEAVDIETLECRRDGWYRVLLTIEVQAVDTETSLTNGSGYCKLSLTAAGATRPAETQLYDKLETHDVLHFSVSPEVGDILEPRQVTVTLCGPIWMYAGETLRAYFDATWPTVSAGPSGLWWLGTFRAKAHKFLIEWIGDEDDTPADGPSPTTTTTTPPPTTLPPTTLPPTTPPPTTAPPTTTTADPTGACCQNGGTCYITTEADCQACIDALECPPGAWQGPATSCSPTPCGGTTYPPLTTTTAAPTGACCQNGGTCYVTTEADCQACIDALECPPGAWQGPGSSCSPNPCGVATTPPPPPPPPPPP